MTTVYVGSDTLNDLIDRSAFGTSDGLSGLGGNDTLLGGFGNDTLDGGTGDDSMVGGDGNDTYYVTYSYDADADVIHRDKVVETSAANSGIDTVITASSGYTLAANVENLTLLAGGVGYGNSLANIITGSDGIDYLYGQGGNDTVRGGKGNDTLYGDEGDDSLEGGEGNDGLFGGLGTDTMVGGDGNDTYYVTTYWDDNDVLHRDTVIEGNSANSGIDTVYTNDNDYTLATNVENLTVFAGVLAHGNGLNNVITGSSASDFLDGLAGNDTILGGGGNDIIWAGDGDDSVDGGDGNDTILGDARYNSSATGLTGNDFLRGGNGNDSLTGGTGNDTLYGDEGNDTLVGSTGNSTLYGGNGDDTYYVGLTTRDAAGNLLRDRVNENDTTGIDTVVVTGSRTIDPDIGGDYTITSNIENTIVLIDADILGNAQDNNITILSPSFSLVEAQGGNDTVLGGAGIDWIAGGDGNDSIDGGNGDDHLSGDGIFTLGYGQVLPGNDILRGGAGNDTLWGGGGNDSLFGDSDNDSLDGGEGDDTLNGGTGNDTLTDTSTTSNDVYTWGRAQGIDTLTDSGGTDRLDVLPGVTANQVWLRHVGNNLEVSVIGSGDTFTVNNWYASAANQVESIKLSDGKTLAANKVDNLVNAMASFTPPAAGQTTLPANYQTALNPVIASSWA